MTNTTSSWWPGDRGSEVESIARRFGEPLVYLAELGTKAQWDRRARLYEVCMVVRRPTGALLTAGKTFYLPGIYRLLTGGVEPGEGIVEALLREVDEETGLNVNVRRFLAIVAYHAEGLVHAAPQAYTFAFLLDEYGGTLAPRDLAEQLAGYSEVSVGDLPLLADNLERLPDVESPELGDTWREWGRYRAVLHRAVGEAFTRFQVPPWESVPQAPPDDHHCGNVYPLHKAWGACFMTAEEVRLLRGQIERARVAIALDEAALTEASAGRDFREVTRLEADLKNRRMHLDDLLLKQTQQVLADKAQESGA